MKFSIFKNKNKGTLTYHKNSVLVDQLSISNTEPRDKAATPEPTEPTEDNYTEYSDSKSNFYLEK